MPQIFHELGRALPVQCIAVLLALQFLTGAYLWNIKKKLYLIFMIHDFFPATLTVHDIFSIYFLFHIFGQLE